MGRQNSRKSEKVVVEHEYMTIAPWTGIDRAAEVRVSVHSPRFNVNREHFSRYGDDAAELSEKTLLLHKSATTAADDGGEAGSTNTSPSLPKPRRVAPMTVKEIIFWGLHLFQVALCGAFTTTFIITKEVLIDNDNYMKECNYDTDCRDLKINQLSLVAAASVNSGALFASPLVMKLGTRRSGLLFSVLWFISVGSSYFTNDTLPGHGMRMLMIMVASAAGVMLFYVALFVSGLEPLDRGDRLRTAMTMLWDVSSATGFLINYLYRDVGWDPFFSLTMIGVIGGSFAILVSIFIVRPVEFTQNTSIPQLFSEGWKVFWTRADPPTRRVSAAFVALAVSILICSYYYFATVRERILKTGVSDNTADRHNSIFGLCVSGLSIIVLPIVSRHIAHNNALPHRRPYLFYPLIYFGMIWLILAIFITEMPPQIQYVTYVIFGGWRVWSFCTFNSWVPAFYGKMGYTILGLVFGFAGFLTFFTPLIDDLCVLVLKRYWPVDLFFGGWTLVSMFYLARALRAKIFLNEHRERYIGSIN